RALVSRLGLFDLAIDQARLTGSGNADLGPAFGADPLFAGQERLDVELMPLGAMKLDSHRDRAARSPLIAESRPWARRTPHYTRPTGHMQAMISDFRFQISAFG